MFDSWGLSALPWWPWVCSAEGWQQPKIQCGVPQDPPFFRKSQKRMSLWIWFMFWFFPLSGDFPPTSLTCKEAKISLLSVVLVLVQSRISWLQKHFLSTIPQELVASQKANSSNSDILGLAIFKQKQSPLSSTKTYFVKHHGFVWWKVHVNLGNVFSIADNKSTISSQELISYSLKVILHIQCKFFSFSATKSCKGQADSPTFEMIFSVYNCSRVWFANTASN